MKQLWDPDDQSVSRRLFSIMGTVTGPRAGAQPPRTSPQTVEPTAVPPSAVEAALPSAVGRAAEPPAPAPALASAFDPGRPGLKAVAVIAAVVVLGAAAAAWFSRPHAESVAPTAATASSTTGGDRTGASIVVAVSGKVRFPGLVRLPPDSRVADAVEAAGGALPGTDMSGVNLARKLVDGELITIGIAAPAGGPSAGGKVNLNTATVAQLDALPGVGPVLAGRIVAYRDRKGGFRSVAELRQVEGIGDAKFEQLKDAVTV